MLRNCASIDEYFDNEWSINLLAWTNISNSKPEIKIGDILATLDLKDSIYNYRKLLIVSSDEYISTEEVIQKYMSVGQIVEGVNVLCVPVPKKITYGLFQFTLWNFDYNTYQTERAINVIFVSDRRIELVAEVLHQKDATAVEETNSFQLYGLGERNFVKEKKKLKLFYSKFQSIYTSFYKYINL